MRPYKFSAGFISADAAAALTEMSRRLAGLQEIVVRPPLSIIRQGWNGQPIIYLDETANSSFFFAQLTSGTSPYSWKERIETAAGTWADGTLTGTSNAYQAVPSTGTPPTPSTNDLVLMRASPNVPGVYEFVSLNGSGLLNSQNTDGTEVDSSTTNLQFDKSTGSKITQSGGISTHTLLAASASQMGAVTTTSQTFDGVKAFNAAVYRTEGSAGSPSYPWVSMDVVTGTNSTATHVTSANGYTGVTLDAQYDSSNNECNTSVVIASGDVSSSSYIAMESFHDTDTNEGTATITLWCNEPPPSASGPMTIKVRDSDGLRGINFYEIAGNPDFDIWEDPSEGGIIRIGKALWFDDIGEGPIVKSPNGNSWLLGVDNAGALTITGPL